MCKMYSKSVYYCNYITLNWIWEILFLDKTHLYWFSDYLLFLLTVYKYSINSSSVGHWVTILTNTKKVSLLETLSVGWWKRRISEAKLKNTVKQSEVRHYMFILSKTLKKNLAVNHWQSQLSTICIFFMNQFLYSQK